MKTWHSPSPAHLMTTFNVHFTYNPHSALVLWFLLGAAVSSPAEPRHLLSGSLWAQPLIGGGGDSHTTVIAAEVVGQQRWRGVEFVLFVFFFLLVFLIIGINIIETTSWISIFLRQWFQSLSAWPPGGHALCRSRTHPLGQTCCPVARRRIKSNLIKKKKRRKK